MVRKSSRVIAVFRGSGFCSLRARSGNSESTRASTPLNFLSRMAMPTSTSVMLLVAERVSRRVFASPSK